MARAGLNVWVTGASSDAAGVDLAIGRRRSVLLVTSLCLVLQLVSANQLVTRFSTPNATTKIAKILVATGRYEGGYWGVLKGPHAKLESREPRVFQLPGEALYVAFLLRYVPEPLRPYAHVPITTLLVASVSYVAALAGGPILGLTTGILASVQPFIVLHGPVWDDTFFAAALVWTVIALLYAAIKPPPSVGSGRPLRRWGRLSVVLALSGYASLLRAESQVILVLVAAFTILVPSMRVARANGVAIILGVLLALGGWGLRNKLAVGEFVVSTTHDGVVLFLSNGPYTKQAVAYGQIDQYMNEETMGAHWDAVADMTEMDADRYFRRQAIRYMVTHPWDVLSTAALKVVVSLAGIRPEEPLKGIRNLSALLPNCVLLFLSACWLYLAGVRSRIRVDVPVFIFFGIVVFAVLAISALGPIGWRYRITIDGVLWIASAWTLVHLFRPLGDNQRAGKH